jgi:hypothetical protein
VVISYGLLSAGTSALKVCISFRGEVLVDMILETRATSPGVARLIFQLKLI